MRNKEMFISLIVMFFLLCNSAMAQTQASGVLNEIRLNKLTDRLEVILLVNKPVEYKSFSLPDPNRFAIDLLQVLEFSCDSLIEVVHFGVRTIRVAKFRPTVTRVVFDLGEVSPSHVVRERGNELIITFWFDAKIEEKIDEKEEKTEAIEKAKIEEVEEEKLLEKKEERVETPVAKEEKEKIEEEKPAEKFPPELPEEAVRNGKIAIIVGFNSGLYFMHSKDFQDMYGNESFYFGGETIFKLPLRRKEYFGASLGFIYISKNGRNISDEESKLKIIPMFLSVFYMRELGVFSPYAGFGIDYIDYKETYLETGSTPSISGLTWGTSVQVGTFIRLVPSLSLRLHFKYRSSHLKKIDRNIKLGGNEYGLMLAYHFNI